MGMLLEKEVLSGVRNPNSNLGIIITLVTTPMKDQGTPKAYFNPF